MPIRKERKHLYPKNWKEIVKQINARAGNRCEGSTDYPDCRAENGKPHPVTGSKVVLTTAHLNHDKAHHAETRRRNQMAKIGQYDFFYATGA